jgi:amino acid permease
MSMHATCTVAFVAVGAIASGLISALETLNKISWFSWVGMTCLLASVITLTIAVSQQDRPADAPRTGPWDKEVTIIGSPSFVDAMNAVSTVFLSYAGAPYYFNIIAEMRDPRHYRKAIILSSSVTSATYLIIGSVVYYYCGQFVSSPALGSAGPLLKKICYGLALVSGALPVRPRTDVQPGLLVSAVLNTHMATKYVFVRFLRNSPHLTQRSFVHYAVWL